MKKRVLAALLSLCLCAGLLPTVALAAEEGTGEGNSVSSETELTAAIQAATGTEDAPTVISLTSDFTTSSVVKVPNGKYITLNGNGHTISRGDTGDHFTTSGNLTLTTHAMFVIEGNLSMESVTVDAKGDEGHLLRTIVVSGNGNLDIYNSIIRGAYHSGGGGGVSVVGTAVANMYSGSIEGNTASSGSGAVADVNGTFNLYGGSIQHNTNIGAGGTISCYSSGAMYLYGGSIINNKNENYLGALYFTSGIKTISGEVLISNNIGRAKKSGTGGDGSYTDYISADIFYIDQNYTYFNDYQNLGYLGTVPVEYGRFNLTSPLKNDLNFIVTQDGSMITRRTLVVGADGYQLTDADLDRIHLTFVNIQNGDVTDITNSDQYLKLILDNRIEFFWKLKVTYDPNCEGVNSATQDVCYGTAFTLNKAPFTRPGYEISGWSTNNDGSGTQYAADASFNTLQTDLTLYAQWKPATYTITYELNGGAVGEDAPSTHTYGTETTLVEPTRAGYSFDGWYLSGDLTGNKVETLTGDGYTSDVVLYAKWTPNTYTINFSGGTGTSGSMDNISATYDQPATLTNNGFTKVGYNFAGWDTDSSADEVMYSNGAQVKNLTETANGTVTLYAVWTDKQVLAPNVSAQTKTYNGKTQSFTLDGSYVITYQQNDQAANPKDAGAYDVSISCEETDTTAAYKNTVYGGLVIDPAPLTITADSKSIYVGDTLPECTYTVSGLAEGDTLTTVPTVACDNADESTAGTYIITASGANAGDNYTITYVNGILTVCTKSSGSSSGSSSSSRYTVTVDSTKNGAVSVSSKSATKSTTVTITVKPDSGYELDSLTVTDKSGDTVELTRKNDTQYTFIMPASKVTVEASFTKTEEQPDVPFTDVSADAYYYDAVAWAVEKGITSGTSATTFSPNASCTRAQMVTFLWRAAGSPAPEGTTSGFTDVKSGEYYTDAVLWATEMGITKGTSTTTFSPHETVTRAQTVTFLYRYAGSPAVSGSNGFKDVPANAYYADAVQWAVANEVTNGMSTTTFSPESDCTRAQIVTLLYRYIVS